MHRGRGLALAVAAASALLALLPLAPARSSGPASAGSSVDGMQVVGGRAPGPVALRLAVRGRPESVGRRVQAVIEEPATGAVAVSAPVVLTPWWQTVGVTATSSSSVLRVGARRDPTDAAWDADEQFDTGDVTLNGGGPTHTARRGRQVLVDNGPYVMRGVVYHPSPIGGTPWTEFWNANPAHCQSDAQLMRAAGINTLRIWYVEATFEASSYRKCMDAFHAAGVKLIWSIQPPSGLNWQVDGDAYLEAYWEHLELAVLRLKNHPATLLWEIGNEVNFRKPEGNDWFRQVNILAGRVKRIDPHHLVTTVLSSVEFFGGAGPVHRKLATNIDLWGLNAYGDRHGIGEERFREMVAADPDRPLWLSEYGVDRYRCVDPGPHGCAAAGSGEDAAAQAAWNGHHWKQISTHLSGADPAGAVVGATMFMWADLWWPALGLSGSGTPLTHDVTGTTSGWTRVAFPDGHHTPEWFGITHALPRDASGPRLTTETYDRFLALFTGRPGPAIVAPSVAGVTACSVVLSWRTDELTVPRVDAGRWRRLGGPGFVTAESFSPDVVVQGRYPRTVHQVTLEGLLPGTTYRALLRVFDGAGRSTGVPAVFRTPAGSC